MAQMQEPSKGGDLGTGSGLAGRHMKSMLSGESFTVPRNWPTLGGAVPRG